MTDTGTTAAVTAKDILKRYKDEIAFVSGEDKATDIGTLAEQLGTAALRFDEAGINGHEDLETAGIHLMEAHHAADDTARTVFLTRADELLYPIVWDMTEEYRSAVAD